MLAIISGVAVMVVFIAGCVVYANTNCLDEDGNEL